MAISKIEWTDVTDNVIVVAGENNTPNGWYCEKVSEGCQNCYAERINGTSFYGGNGLKYRKSKSGPPPLMLRHDLLASWQRQTAPKKHFVNSMTDTFGEFVPKEWIFEILDAMAASPKQTFQVLTKRTERMYNVIMEWLHDRRLSFVPENIWLGTSVENQERADERIPDLLKIPAIRFLSCEPLLGEIDLSIAIEHDSTDGFPDHVHIQNGMLDWVIVGGESGPNARPMHPNWARGLRDQCQAAGTPFFFKQWTKRAGRVLDGREHNDFPQQV